VPCLVKIGQENLEKILNDLTQVLHFCDYLYFEKDLVVYWNKLENNLYQALSEFGLLVLKKVF
jgi:hypothetical protein